MKVLIFLQAILFQIHAQVNGIRVQYSPHVMRADRLGVNVGQATRATGTIVKKLINVKEKMADVANMPSADTLDQ